MKPNLALLSTLLLLTATPETAGAQRLRAVDSAMFAVIASGKVPGGVALVMSQGRIVHHQAYGSADPVGRQPMDTASVFRIASMTKAVVSVALLQLVASKGLSLDMPVERLLPAFGPQQVAVPENGTYRQIEKNRSVTLRDLLTHRSGISSATEHPAFTALFRKYGLESPLGLGFTDLAAQVDAIAAMPLVHQPGARFSYGSSTEVVGRLVEVLSGMPLDRYLRRHVFRPLGMNDTGFRLRASQASRLVPVCMTGQDSRLTTVDTALFKVDFPLDRKSRYVSAAGGLVSTASDYARFLQCLLDGGVRNGVRILEGRWVDSLVTNQLGDATFIFGGIRSLNRFGLGVGLTSRAGTAITHASEGSFFWGGALNTSYLVDPRRGILTVFLFQRLPFDLAPVLSSLERTAFDALLSGSNMQ
jgi:CubicO group peptidase (beta-lactamase class C family)